MARVILKGETPETAGAFQRVAARLTLDELRAIQERGRKGMLNGGTYNTTSRKSGCFFGTLAFLRENTENPLRGASIAYNFGPDGLAVEEFFLSILPGDKPKNSKHSLKLDRWLTKAITGVAV